MTSRDTHAPLALLNETAFLFAGIVSYIKIRSGGHEHRCISSSILSCYAVFKLNVACQVCGYGRAYVTFELPISLGQNFSAIHRNHRGLPRYSRSLGSFAAIPYHITPYCTIAISNHTCLTTSIPCKFWKCFFFARTIAVFWVYSSCLSKMFTTHIL
jgi:hypothetical protein